MFYATTQHDILVRKILLTAMLIFSCSTYGVTIEYGDGLDPAVKKTIETTIENLPTELLSAIEGHTIEVDFENFGGKFPINTVTKCEQGGSEQAESILAQYSPSFFGDSKVHKIKIHSGFIPYLVGDKGDIQFNCRHKSITKTFIGSFIHEVAHIYDELNLPTQSFEEKKLREKCRRLKRESTRGSVVKNTEPLKCKFLRKYKHTVSDRFPFIYIAGFSSNGKVKNKLGRLDTETSRSVDEYEFENLQESFAVNFEYFILDEEFRCRKPAMSMVFESKFPSFKRHSRCKINYNLFTSLNLGSVNIDPERVHSIHYLLADKGEALESKFGHSMFRIIVCAPEREEVSEDCVEDLSHHVIVSYRANQAGIQTDYISGIVGKDPSQLFIFSLADMIKEYNVGDNRSLVSIPLQLERFERELFLKNVLERYWSYRGRYYFVNNNCATESQQHLLASLKEDSLNTFSKKSLVAVPTLIQFDWEKTGLITSNDIKESYENRNQYFPSYRSVAQQQFEKLKSNVDGDSVNVDFEELFTKLDTEDRRRLFDRFMLNLPKNGNQVVSFFLRLESLYKEHLNQKLKKNMSVAVKEMNENTGDDNALTNLSKSLFKTREKLMPWNLISSEGYGVPFDNEVLSNEEIVELQEDFQETYLNIHNLYIDLFPNIPTELKSIKSNVRYYLTHVQR